MSLYDRIVIVEGVARIDSDAPKYEVKQRPTRKGEIGGAQAYLQKRQAMAQEIIGDGEDPSW